MKISVIIPTYNRADLLPRTIRSVLAQTFRGWELLVVDDGSTDDTHRVVASFQHLDARIKYVRQTNSGAPARPKNTGIRHARGEYIAFLDHDDEWFPEKLEKQFRLFKTSKKSNLGLVGCNGWIVDASGARTANLVMPREGDYMGELLKRNFFATSSSVMVKKSVFDRIGMHDERFIMGDDWDMWVRVASVFSIDFVYEPLFKYYRHAANVSARMQPLEKIHEYEREIAKHRDLYQRYPASYAKRLVDVGRMYFLANGPQKARNYWIEAIRIRPQHIRAYANLAVSLLGKTVYTVWLRIR